MLPFCFGTLKVKQSKCNGYNGSCSFKVFLKHSAVQITVQRSSQLSESTGSFQFCHTCSYCDFQVSVVLARLPGHCASLCRHPGALPHPALVFIVPSSAHNQSTHPHTCHRIIHMLTSAHYNIYIFYSPRASARVINWNTFILVVDNLLTFPMVTTGEILFCFFLVFFVY